MKTKKKTLKIFMSVVSALVLTVGGLVVANGVLNGEFALPSGLFDNLWEKNIEDLRAEYDEKGDDLKTQKEKRTESAELTGEGGEEFDLGDEEVPLADLPNLPEAKPQENRNNSPNPGEAPVPNIELPPVEPPAENPVDPSKNGVPQTPDERKKQKDEDKLPEYVEIQADGLAVQTNLERESGKTTNITLTPFDDRVFEKDGQKYINLQAWLVYDERPEGEYRLEVADVSSGKVVYSGKKKFSTNLPLEDGVSYRYRLNAILDGASVDKVTYNITYREDATQENPTPTDQILKEYKIDKKIITIGKGTDVKSNIMEILCQKNSEGRRVVRGQILRIVPKTAEGGKLYASNIRVIVDGWTVTSPTGNGTYEFLIKTGKPQAGDKALHEIKIIVDDGNGNITEEIYVFEEDFVGEEVEIGTATIRLDCTTVGWTDYEEVEVPIYSDQPASVQVAEALKKMKYEIKYSGSITDGFYLQGIRYNNYFTKLTIPKTLWKCVLNDGIPVNEDEIASLNDPTRIEGDWLSEFVFTRWSGWMYCVNGYYPGRGMSDYYLKDGDVLSLRFTLCMGKDIGGYRGAGYDGGNFDRYCGTWIEGEENIHHVYNEHDVCKYCGTPSENHQHVLDSNGSCLYCDKHEHIWIDKTLYEWSGFYYYECSICGEKKTVPKKEYPPEYDTGKEIEKLIAGLKVNSFYVIEEEGEALKNARAVYESASDMVKRYVSSDSVRRLSDLEKKYAELIEAVEIAKQLDEKVLNFGEVTYESGTSLAAIKKEYDEASEAVKRNTTAFGEWGSLELDNAPYYILEEKYDEIYEREHYPKVAKELEERIANLGEITEYSDALKKELVSIRKAYDEDLRLGKKAEVSNIDTFHQAYAKTTELLIERLAEYKDVTWDSDYDEIEDFEAATSKATDMYAFMLEGSREKLSKESVEMIEEATARCTLFKNLEAAEEVEFRIADLEQYLTNMSVVIRSDIKKARAAYEKLNENAKALVSNYDLLEKVEDAFAQYVAPDEAYEVEQEINWILTVTLESEEQLKRIREMYDNLSDYAKAMVDNYDVLVEAEKTLAELQKPPIEDPKDNPIIDPKESAEEDSGEVKKIEEVDSEEASEEASEAKVEEAEKIAEVAEAEASEESEEPVEG